MATAEYWEYDMWDTYITCPLCGEYFSAHDGEPSDGDVIECLCCDKYFVFGQEYPDF